MTRDQKKQYVIQLHAENRNIRDIAKYTHLSFRDIGAILKRHKENIERQNGQLEEKDDIKSKSKKTRENDTGYQDVLRRPISHRGSYRTRLFTRRSKDDLSPIFGNRKYV